MPSAPLHVKVRLGAMMFLQFAINGIWVIPLVTYLKAVHYTDPQVALAYSTLPWAAIVAPLFVGMIADRFFAADKVLACAESPGRRAALPCLAGGRGPRRLAAARAVLLGPPGALRATCPRGR